MSRKLLSLSATAALMGGAAMADVPDVAVDITPVHSLVSRVMEGVGTPALIVQPGASPHEYSLRPSEAGALQEADLVFWMGEGLTPWMEDAIETLAQGAAVTTLLEADETTLLAFREGALFEAHDHAAHGEEHDHDAHDHDGHDHNAHEHDGHEHDAHDHDGHDHDAHEHDGHEHDGHDHDGHEHDGHDHDGHDHDGHDHDGHEHDEHDHDAHDHDGHDHDGHDHEGHDHEGHDHEGHDHGEHDPHAWLSPENARSWLNLIAARLSAADPDNADTYFANAVAAREELEALSAEINETLDPVRGGSFIVFHDAYQYFESEFDFPASGAISLSDASEPSPARIAEIQGRIREEGIDCVLAEPQFNPGIVAVVLDGTDANTGVIDPLGAELETGPGLYPQLLRNMAVTLAECL